MLKEYIAPILEEPEEEEEAASPPLLGQGNHNTTIVMVNNERRSQDSKGAADITTDKSANVALDNTDQSFFAATVGNLAQADEGFTSPRTAVDR